MELASDPRRSHVGVKTDGPNVFTLLLFSREALFQGNSSVTILCSIFREDNRQNVVAGNETQRSRSERDSRTAQAKVTPRRLTTREWKFTARCFPSLVPARLEINSIILGCRRAENSHSGRVRISTARIFPSVAHSRLPRVSERERKAIEIPRPLVFQPNNHAFPRHVFRAQHVSREELSRAALYSRTCREEEEKADDDDVSRAGTLLPPPYGFP